ncbi:hypothetical protein KKI24_09640 [bacterium]|nr:hypothetical protein [bacterium]
MKCETCSIERIHHWSYWETSCFPNLSIRAPILGSEVQFCFFIIPLAVCTAIAFSLTMSLTIAGGG